MAESIISKYDRRAIFPVGEQSRFLKEARARCNLSWIQFAVKLEVHKRTLNDWRREKYSLPFTKLKVICRTSKKKIPSSIEVKDPFWYASKGARLGGIALHKKYGNIVGDPEYRKKRWYEWWEREGKFKRDSITFPQPIRKPRYSKDLAEFVGIMMGDGGITKNQLKITIHSKDDRDYSRFIKNLVEKLFDVPISVFYHKDKLAMDLMVSRTELVRFCNETLGLKIGNKLKQGLDIPDWIKQSREFQKECMRGLMDTDGCIFNECHNIKGKKYCYPRLAFTSYSEALCLSVFEIFENLGFQPKIRIRRNVQLEKKEDILGYFRIIGTNNPKHQKRFKSFLRRS